GLFPLQKSPTEILSSAAENGAKIVAALSEYSYYSELTVETVSNADIVTGKYYRFSQMTFDTSGNRVEKTLENTSTLPKDLYIGTQASNNLARGYVFFVTPGTLRQYQFNYVGREHIDELNTYVFDISPRPGAQSSDSVDRVFKGRIWVDD